MVCVATALVTLISHVVCCHIFRAICINMDGLKERGEEIYFVYLESCDGLGLACLPHHIYCLPHSDWYW